MRKLLLAPDADGYSSADGTEVIATQLAGGPSRYRQDVIGAPKIVSVAWTMNPSQYAYWRAFYASVTKNGALAFLCDLVSEDGNGPAEHVCNFVPGSVQLPAQRGFTYVQQAQLEAKPLARNAAADEQTIAFFEASGGNPDAFAKSLAYFTLVKVPGTPGFSA